MRTAPPAVIVLNGLDFRDKRTTITKGADGVYGLQVMIAQCKSPEKLGRWALEAGAREARHDYDCTSKGDAERAAAALGSAA